MGDDHAPAGDVGRNLRQAFGDVLLGEAMEAVAPDAFGMQLVRNGVVIRQCIMVAMECGIEAGHLRQRREVVQ
jgi:hypothetical protein